MSWYFYVLEFVSGLLLTNGVPHFVEVVSGHRFQPPFGYPPGIGESSLLSNALWGFANLAADLFFSGSTCLKVLQPDGSSWPWASWLPLSRYLPTSAECAEDKLENSRIESGIASIRSALREGVLE
jgi:hypothetical protein